MSKKNRILFIFPTPKRKELYVNVLPPLGILGIASYLEENGFNCDVIDCHVMSLDKDYRQYDTICFSVNIANIENTKKIIEEIKTINPSAKIIIGGPFVVKRAKKLLTFLNADVMVIGEAEDTILNYLRSSNPHEVQGLVLKDKKMNIIYTGKPKLKFNLDKFPFPALDKVPIKKYNMSIKKAFPVSSIITSRGCPNECIFCYHEKVWRQRSAKHVVDEIEWQVKKLGVREVVVWDDNFTCNKKRIMDICRLINQRKIKVWLNLNNGIRADRTDYEMLEAMKKAGVWFLGVAPEVGDDKNLIKIKKGFTLKNVENVIKWSKKLGIVNMAFFTIGYPWETRENIIQTIEYAKKLDPDLVQFSIVTPVEGTELYNKVVLKSNYDFEETGLFLNKSKYEMLYLSTKDIVALVKKAYRKFYLRPRKALTLMKKLKPSDLFTLMKYAFITESI